ncbi:hypothetical protein SKAU_G00382830 [Synaphobranchus kaupii]|uniref:Uncharacterized protein n=1 Tax=Synaphobranchus kaupii TaxID=118154 RepID=A0A9Q1ICT2_SYNKA|nr:hypothetical protein SKAU_G00382830 [Synaphobranchus kaupii]
MTEWEVSPNRCCGCKRPRSNRPFFLRKHPLKKPLFKDLSLILSCHIHITKIQKEEGRHGRCGVSVVPPVLWVGGRLVPALRIFSPRGMALFAGNDGGVEEAPLPSRRDGGEKD